MSITPASRRTRRRKGHQGPGLQKGRLSRVQAAAEARGSALPHI